MGRLVVLLALVATLAGCGGAGPTPTPTFARYRAEDAYSAFQKAGLPVSGWEAHAVPAGAEPPGTWAESYRFVVASVAPAGGQVFACVTPADRDATVAWLARFPASDPYVYTQGNLVVTMSFDLPRAEADRYRAALAALP